MMPNHTTIMILWYTVKLDTMPKSGDDMGPGALQTENKHFVGIFEQHRSWTTNTIHMLFTNCSIYNRYITNIYMLFANSVSYNNCDHNIYMLFKTLNNLRKKNCTRWGGFEIIPTNKIVPVSCYWAGSFRPRARCFFHGRPAQPAILEATRPIPLYQPRTGYAASRYEAVVGELGCDASLPSSACIAFLYWRASAKTILILAEEISLTFVPRGFAVLRSGTKPQSHPNRLHWQVCLSVCWYVCLFVCLFVCLCCLFCLFVGIKPEKLYSTSCDWEESKPPESGHTRTEAQSTCLPKTATHTTYVSIYG